MISLARAELASRVRWLVGIAAGCVALFTLFGLTYASMGPEVRALASRPGGGGSSLVRAFTGSRAGDPFSPLGYLAFAFNHPLFLVLSLSVGVSMGTAAIAGDVESGRAQLLFTRARSRHHIVATRVVAWLVAQTGLAVVALAGAITGGSLAPAVREAGVGRLVGVAVQFVPLALFVGALSFAASAWSHTRGRAVAVATGLTVLAYLANLTSLLWSPARWLRPLTPFGYYEPLAAVRGVRWVDVAVLTAGALALLLGSAFAVERRDLA